MTLTNFPNGVSSFGAPIFGPGGLIPVPGDVYWVAQTGIVTLASDGNDGLSPEKPKVKLSAVQSSMTAEQNDTVIVLGHSSASTGAVRESANLAWTKNLTHIVGNAHNRVAHRVSLRETSGGTAVTKMMDNSASGCVFANFHIFQGQSTAEDQYGWDESGERNTFYNLHIAGMGHQTPADRAGSRDILITGGGEHYFKDCVIGLDTVNRGADNSCLELASASTRIIFEDCVFQIRADATTPQFVEVGVGGMDRYLIFKHCHMTNAGTFTGGSTLAQAFDVNASPGGVILFVDGSSATGVTALETTASARVYTTPIPAAATGGEATANTG